MQDRQDRLAIRPTLNRVLRPANGRDVVPHDLRLGGQVFELAQ
jgi:hypothetical protein